MATYGLLSGAGRRQRWILRAGLALTAAFVLSLATSARAEAECMTPQACYDQANWQRAVATQYFNEGVYFREYSKHYFVQAKEWGDKATFAFHAGDGTAAVWYKAIADDYSRKAVDNAKAADQRFAQAAFTSAAADGSFNRGLTLQWDVGPSYPEGILTTAGNPGGRYNCTGAAKTIKNERDIEAGTIFREKIFAYRIETSWKFCNGQITQMYPAVPWQKVYTLASDVGWRFDHWDKTRPATCYGGTPERCAWTYQFIWRWDRPNDADRYRDTCVTTQVKGNGAHYRHGSCGLRSWTGDSWGGAE